MGNEVGGAGIRSGRVLAVKYRGRNLLGGSRHK
jgi:hypothetical protein